MSRLQSYLEKTKSVSAPPPPTLEALARRINEISTLPNSAIRLMEVASDSNSGAADLKEAVESDAALSARILRCVNSSAYATRVKITNLQQAIAYLGLKQVRNLAMTASVSELFKRDKAFGGYRRSGLWQHLVAVGICSRLIAMRRKMAEFEDAFLAGLLHDIGIILEDQHFHDGFRNVVQSLEENKTLAEIERDHFGFDHTMLAERVADAWSFPQTVKATVRYHHASVTYRGEEIDVVRCVEVANIICTLKGITSVGRKLVKVSQPALEGLSLTRTDIAVLAADLDEELAHNSSLFAI